MFLKQSNDGQLWEILVTFVWLTESAKKEIKGFNLVGIAISHSSIFYAHISKNCKTTSAKIQSLNRKRNAPEIKKTSQSTV